jgi:hypothetical protein
MLELLPQEKGDSIEKSTLGRHRLVDSESKSDCRFLICFIRVSDNFISVNSDRRSIKKRKVLSCSLIKPHIGVGTRAISKNE